MGGDSAAGTAMIFPDAIPEIRRSLCGDCQCGADTTDPCAICPRGNWPLWHGCKETIPAAPQDRPEYSSQGLVVSAAKAMAAEIKARLLGEPPRSEEAIEAALAICRGCEKFEPKQERCTLCGCFMQLKTRLRSQSCPIGKW